MALAFISLLLFILPINYQISMAYTIFIQYTVSQKQESTFDHYVRPHKAFPLEAISTAIFPFIHRALDMIILFPIYLLHNIL